MQEFTWGETCPKTLARPEGQLLSLSRRDLLRMGAYAGAGLLAPRRGVLAQAAASHSGMNMLAATPKAAGQASAPVPPPVTLASYVTALSIPPVIRPKPGAPVQIRMRPFRQKVHRDLPPTTMWGYNNSWPGPTFEVRKGQAVSVEWINELPLRHFLPVDP